MDEETAIVNSVTIKEEWFELRLHPSMHCRSLSMPEVLKLLTTDTILNNKHTLTLSDWHRYACLTLSISIVDYERAFSTIRQINSRLRSEMCNSSLNHCMWISMEGPPLQQFDFEGTIDACKNRC